MDLFYNSQEGLLIIKQQEWDGMRKKSGSRSSRSGFCILITRFDLVILSSGKAPFLIFDGSFRSHLQAFYRLSYSEL
uniref:Uncharacterized protein n=1 Tax=Meloidogyne enterolobii TaxID=390850 RepID=A0A6V7V425_MELEN|nr:unnamed protein product [Meloidogyne enterolobii]